MSPQSVKTERRHPVGLFWRRRDGAIAVAFAILLAVFLGMTALSFDLGRAFNLHTQLQHAVDASALAAATQLDGDAGARNRACLAAVGQPFDCFDLVLDATVALAENTQSFANDGQGAPVARFDVNFLIDLAKDAGGNYLNPATGDDDANFVEVIATPRTVTNWFAGVIGAATSTPVKARAVAGIGSAYCQVPPMFVCQPGGNPFTNADIGKGVWMKGKDPGAGGGAWVDGNFGILALPGAILSAAAIRDAMGKVNPDASCFGVGGTEQTKPGETTSVKKGMNVRFDMYENPMAGGGYQDNPQYQPSANNVKGLLWGGAQCGPTNNAQGWHHPDVAGGNKYDGPGDPDVPVADAMGFPRDTCAYTVGLPEGGTGTCRPGAAGGRFGDGDWDFGNYMEINHNSIWPIAENVWDNNFGDGNGTARRWEVYEWEKAGNLSENVPKEKTGPVCYTGGPVPDPVVIPANDRRLLCIAAVDCTGLGGGTQPVTVDQWVGMFLTEPIGHYDGDNKSIYMEIVGYDACAGPDVIAAHDVVQLYE